MEEAARWLAENGDPESGPLTFREYSRELDALYTLIDEIRRLRAEQGAIAARKRPKRVNPTPRPKTAAERAEKKAALLAHKRMVAQLIPGGG